MRRRWQLTSWTRWGVHDAPDRMLREGRQGQPAAGVLQSLQSGQTHGSVDQQPLWKGLRGLWLGAADSHGDEVVRRQRCGLGQQRSAILPDSSLAIIWSQFTTSPLHPMAPFSLSEGDKSIGLRSLQQVDHEHKLPRTGPQWMAAVGLCQVVGPICASPGTVVSPRLLLPEKLHPSVTCGPSIRFSPRANSDQTPRCERIRHNRAGPSLSRHWSPNYLEAYVFQVTCPRQRWQEVTFKPQNDIWTSIQVWGGGI